MAVDSSSVVVAAIMAASNIGGVGLLLAWYMKRVDANTATAEEHSKMLARAAENQKATAETLERVQKNVDDLYNSRNVHEKKIVEVDTLHDLKGCKQFFQGGKGQ